MDFIYQLGGIEKRPPGDIKVQFHNEQGEIEFAPASIYIAERVHLSEPIFAEHFRFLQSQAEDGVTPKLTIPSPSMVHYRGGRAAIDPTVYPGRRSILDRPHRGVRGPGQGGRRDGRPLPAV